jgi:iron complex outermembrane recepter protein
MRIARSTLIGTAVAMALFGSNAALHAQTVVQPPSDGAPPAQAAGADQAAKPGDLQEVVVTGLRFAMEQSIEKKKAAVATVEVVTAEDIGKMPDKNVADALQRLPGVNVSAAGANEGGFDEADRVSMRGTNPSYTQTLVDGHFVASGDWFVLDQTGTVGRSVSYTLLPSEIVSQVTVQKTSQADLVEGGIAGSVDIITRKPLDFHQSNTLEASAGAVYSDLPNKTEPQFNVLGNWINDAHNFGVLIQGFSETRDLRRDGQEILNYGQIAPGSAIALKDPNLANVSYPGLIDSALFEQTRQRNGGLIDIEFQANDALSFNATGFYSKMNATDYNRSYSFWGNNVIASGSGQAPNPGYVVQNGTLVSASFTGVPGTNYGVYDQISRPDESADSNFGNLDINWQASDQLKFLGQVGVSTGHGRTPTQDVSETVAGTGNGASYQLNGTTTAANWNLGNTVVNSPQPGGVPVGFSWIFGDQNMDVLDKETWAKIDGDYKFDAGSFQNLEFGVRFSDHQRHLWGVIGQGPILPGASNAANYPVGWQNFPSDFGSGLGSGFPNNIWYWSPQQLAQYDADFANRDPSTRADWTSDYGLEEKDSAAFIQGNWVGTGWSGNLGLRVVRTGEDVIDNVPAATGQPGAITTSAFGPYVQQETNNNYTDVLPSGNLKIDLSPDLVGRLAAAETLGRPDYSALAGSNTVTISPTAPAATGSASGGNPNLKPIRADNYDAALEWYFQPKALLAVDAFYMDLHDYVGLGSVTRQFFTENSTYPNGFFGNYSVTVPYNATGKVEGAEFNYQQTFFENWGVSSNFTWANGTQTSGVPVGGDTRLVGTSKQTFNAIGFYENKSFSARVAYNYRSAFYSGLDRSTAFTQAGMGTWAASLGYKVNESCSLTLDGMNLNNPTLKYYAQGTDQPRAFYKNGSQYYLNLRFKL